MKLEKVADANADLWAQVMDILCSFKPVKRIILFGSRAQGMARRTSDIDLAVEGEAWTDRDVNLAHDRLEEEIPTPLTFDLVNLSAVANSKFRKAILATGKTLYER